jgi:hypothetical protein
MDSDSTVVEGPPGCMTMVLVAERGVGSERGGLVPAEKADGGGDVVIRNVGVGGGRGLKRIRGGMGGQMSGGALGSGDPRG